MAQPFIAEKGVIRLSPLEKAVASSSSTNTGNGPEANRASADPTRASSQPRLPEGVTEAQIAEAAAKAENGDQAAIDWLASLGLIAGAAAGGYAIYSVLRNRGSKKGASIGADNIANEAAPPNATSAVAKRTKPVDLYIDRTPPAPTPPVKLLPAPTKQIPRFDPALGSEAIRAIRRLP